MGNEKIKEKLVEIAYWITCMAQESSFAHDELKLLHYADTVRAAANKIAEQETVIAWGKMIIEMRKIHEEVNRSESPNS